MYTRYTVKSANDHRFLDNQLKQTIPTMFRTAPNTGATFSATLARPLANFLVALAPALTVPRQAMTMVVMIPAAEMAIAEKLKRFSLAQLVNLFSLLMSPIFASVLISFFTKPVSGFWLFLILCISAFSSITSTTPVSCLVLTLFLSTFFASFSFSLQCGNSASVRNLFGSVLSESSSAF